MFKAVPNLGSLAAGWTIHPYGPNWASRIDSTDNGRTLSDNYGWDTSMTYNEAATTLHSVLTGMQSRYGSRLGAFFLYQAHDQYATGTRTGRGVLRSALARQVAQGRIHDRGDDGPRRALKHAAPRHILTLPARPWRAGARLDIRPEMQA